MKHDWMKHERTMVKVNLWVCKWMNQRSLHFYIWSARGFMNESKCINKSCQVTSEQSHSFSTDNIFQELSYQ